MSYQERKKKILAAVSEEGSLSVFQLAEKTGSSPATIRRDLHSISEEGLLIRTHGGAMQHDGQALTGFSDKSGQHDDRKTSIARLASTHVREGDQIFMDCGSTVFKMCRFLKSMRNLHIVTNSLPILSEFMEAPGISINFIGGEIDKKRKAVHGLKAIEHINGYHVRKAFIGVDGISAASGLTAHSETEASTTAAFARNAEQVILLCDSSKIGKDSYLQFAPLSLVSLLITDPLINTTEKQLLTGQGLAIALAE